VELARWKERLDFEAGVVKPREVSIDLPSPASSAVQAVAEGWRLLVGLRDARWGHDQPFTFGRAFVRAWCGVSDEQARRAVRVLEDAGVLVRVGRHGRLILWRPGAPPVGPPSVDGSMD
jgi:hypothetical protein